MKLGLSGLKTPLTRWRKMHSSYSFPLLVPQTHTQRDVRSTRMSTACWTWSSIARVLPAHGGELRMGNVPRYPLENLNRGAGCSGVADGDGVGSCLGVGCFTLKWLFNPRLKHSAGGSGANRFILKWWTVGFSRKIATSYQKGLNQFLWTVMTFAVQFWVCLRDSLWK